MYAKELNWCFAGESNFLTLSVHLDCTSRIHIHAEGMHDICKVNRRVKCGVKWLTESNTVSHCQSMEHPYLVHGILFVFKPETHLNMD